MIDRIIMGVIRLFKLAVSLGLVVLIALIVSTQFSPVDMVTFTELLGLGISLIGTGWLGLTLFGFNFEFNFLEATNEESNIQYRRSRSNDRK